METNSHGPNLLLLDLYRSRWDRPVKSSRYKISTDHNKISQLLPRPKYRGFCRSRQGLYRSHQNPAVNTSSLPVKSSTVDFPITSTGYVEISTGHPAFPTILPPPLPPSGPGPQAPGPADGERFLSKDLGQNGLTLRGS